jgi:ribosome-associated heat shock protein Hsp15
MERVRLDKWLWAARFFKTRVLAVKACELGRVECREQRLKPARDVRVGEVLKVTTAAGIFEVEVLGLSEMRGPAVVAQTLYRETDAGRAARLLAAEQRKALDWLDAPRDGRPTKRDRRKIDRFRGVSRGE